MGSLFPLYSMNYWDPLLLGCSVRLLSTVLSLLCPQMLPGVCSVLHHIQLCHLLSGWGFIS